MTHSLHRSGSVESLAGDYVLIAACTRGNREAMAPALVEAARILLELEPTNLGSSRVGTNSLIGFDQAEFLRELREADSVACTFSSREGLKEAVARLKQADLGISITLSGLTEEILPLAGGVGLQPHSICLSLGVTGETRGMAEGEALDLITMCGHCRISEGLARQAARNVASGVQSAWEASKMLGKPCTCGLFNADRAETLLARLASQEEGR